MRKMLWVAILIGSLLLMGAMVATPEMSPQSTFPRMAGMVSMMGIGMMGEEGQKGQMGQRRPMTPMMEGMMQVMDACSQIMDGASCVSQEGNK